jgi:hypothetical protein
MDSHALFVAEGLRVVTGKQSIKIHIKFGSVIKFVATQGFILVN